jgi:hypothetical protein
LASMSSYLHAVIHKACHCQLHPAREPSASQPE